MNFFSVHNLTAGYGKHPLLTNLSFQIESGCLVGLLGANGIGKTTLLKALCGILPHQGTCTLENTVLETLSPKPLAKLVRYIPQQSGISIDISALDVVLMGFNPYLGLLESPTASMKQTAIEALAAVGLAGREHTNYQHLSQDKKQLCILARTFVSDSRLLLLDEPESALDFHFRDHMLTLMQKWVSAGNRCAIVALHDPALALHYCNRLLLLSKDGIFRTEDPKTCPLEELEKQLSVLYGNISLQLCRTRRGESRIVLLKEKEP